MERDHAEQDPGGCDGDGERDSNSLHLFLLLARLDSSIVS
jgi:hypothetical protein